MRVPSKIIFYLLQDSRTFRAGKAREGRVLTGSAVLAFLGGFKVSSGTVSWYRSSVLY